MTVTTSFPPQLFSSTVPDIKALTDETRVHVVMRLDTSEVYNEYLYPDKDGSIEITDIPALVTLFLRQKLIATLTVELHEERLSGNSSDGETEETDSAQLTSSLVYCAALVEDDAQTFCTNNFLSILQGAKMTSVGRLEYLHYTGSDGASVTAHYDDGSTQTFAATKVGGNSSYSTIDVSPARFASEAKTLCSFEVTAGARKQTYEIDQGNPDAAPVLLFVNSFGCQEIVYCTGTHEVSPEFKYSSAYIGVNMKNYDIEETRKFNADTGVLSYPMAFWINDLFRSDEVQLLNFVNGEPKPGKMVVITDVNAEYDNNLDSMPRFKFTYTYAQRNHNVLDTARAGRIFDNTFDNTFN
jgi:hypothetical protein